MSTKTQFNVYLPPELVKAIKHRAIDEGLSLSALVEQVLGDYVHPHESAHNEGAMHTDHAEEDR